ncbi:MAG: DUF3179 domain-containing protein [bacterium]
MPVLLGMPPFAPLIMPEMRPVAIGSLIGHLMYGLILGATYVWLARAMTRPRWSSEVWAGLHPRAGGCARIKEDTARGERMRGVAVLLVVALVIGEGVTVRAAHRGERIPFDTSEWKTDFTKHSIPLSEIISGGPPKDGIPAIDKPAFESLEAAGKWLKPNEPVILVERNGDPRAYPMQILIWHEIVNDTVGGTPTTITFCPLCNTAIAFDRRLDGLVLDFGTTGRLRFSDLVMYDRQSESWWQQITGEAIVGSLTGKRLSMLPAQIVAWETFRQTFPKGKVLSRNTGFPRSYGANPYVGYDDINSSPFLYSGPQDKRLRPMERVVTVSIEREDVAYPFSTLERVRVVNDAAGGTPLVVIFVKGVASALDRSSIADSRDIGTAAVFQRRLDGRTLTFVRRADDIIDQQTKSTWSILGRATAGPLRGKTLAPVVSGQHFWFAWAVFKPKTRIYTP